MSSQVNYKLIWKAARWSRSVSTAFEPSEVSPYPRDVSETMVPAAPPPQVGQVAFFSCGAISGPAVLCWARVEPQKSCCWPTLSSEALGRNLPWYFLPQCTFLPPKEDNKMKEKGLKLQLTQRYTKAMPRYQLRNSALGDIVKGTVTVE